MPKIGVILLRVQILEAKDENEAIMKACDSLKAKDTTVIVIPTETIEAEQLTENDIISRLKENLP